VICVLWLHKHGQPLRDVYGGGDNVAFMLLRPGDVFRYHDRYVMHDGYYIVTRRDVTISGARADFVLHATECAPPDEVVS
jgi:hypothetical protein